MNHQKDYKDAAGNILIGSSFLRAFLDENSCPKYLEAIFITQRHKSETTEAMLRGLYFEQKVLGATASKDESPIELPKNKNGSLKADEERINMQINNFTQVIENYKISIHQTQVPMYQALNEHYKLGTISDIVGTIDDPEYGFVEHAIFDVKLTKDLKSTFGDFQWGEPERKDFTQAYLSVAAYYAEHGVYPKFYYLVFGYGPEMGYDVIEKKVNGNDLMELQESVRVTLNTMLQYEEAGWFTRPSYDNCKNCPLAYKCDKKLTFQPITRV